MELRAGGVELRGVQCVAYTTQSAFLANLSLRDNILFGMPFDEPRYREV
jgi:hypothetical protein